MGQDGFSLAKEMGLRAYLESIEKQLIEQALLQTAGNVARAGALLRVKRTTLVEKIKRLFSRAQ